MSDSYVVKFEYDNNHRKFNATNILTNDRNGLIYLDFFEETLPLIREFRFNADGSTEQSQREADLINVIHATAVIPPGQIPHIIQTLQSFYINYVNNQTGGASEDGSNE